MKLFFSPGTCAIVPHILLHEAKLSFTPVRVRFASRTRRRAARTITRDQSERPRYRCSSWKTASVSPKDPSLRSTSRDPRRPQRSHAAGRLDAFGYRVMEWQAHISSELHKVVRRRCSNPTSTIHAKTALKQALRKKYEWIASRLEGRDFLTGTNFTADADALYGVIRVGRTDSISISPIWHRYRALCVR